MTNTIAEMNTSVETPRPIPTSRVGIIYGYLVCLIALIVALVGANTIVSRLVDMAFVAPSTLKEVSRDDQSPAQTFRAYKQQVIDQRTERILELRQKINQNNNNGTALTSQDLKPALDDAMRIPSDEDLKLEYDKVVVEQQKKVPQLQLAAVEERRREIARDLLSGIQMLVTGAILFFIHWRWVQRRVERAPITSSNLPVPSST